MRGGTEVPNPGVKSDEGRFAEEDWHATETYLTDVGR